MADRKPLSLDQLSLIPVKKLIEAVDALDSTKPSTVVILPPGLINTPPSLIKIAITERTKPDLDVDFAGSTQIGRR